MSGDGVHEFLAAMIYAVNSGERVRIILGRDPFGLSKCLNAHEVRVLAELWGVPAKPERETMRIKLDELEMFEVGETVKVFDRYRLTAPALGKITQFSKGNNGVCVRLFEGQNSSADHAGKRYTDFWVDMAQIRKALRVVDEIWELLHQPKGPHVGHNGRVDMALAEAVLCIEGMSPKIPDEAETLLDDKLRSIRDILKGEKVRDVPKP